MAFTKSIVHSGFPRMSMQKFKGQMMLMPNKKGSNKMASKKKETEFPKGFAPNIVWMDIKPASANSKKSSSKKKK